DLGFWYARGVLIPDDTPLPPSDSQIYIPCARPGSRAPHMWLRPLHTETKEPATVSTLDLFERGFTLLTDAAGQRWCSAARYAAEDLGIPFTAFVIGPGGDFESRGADWNDLYGVDVGGAVLVRPDGHVAWRCRSQSTEPETAMAAVLRMMAGRRG